MTWPGGRTRFGQAKLAFALAGGSAELTEGVIDMRDLETLIEGRVSLADGMLAMTATTRPVATDAATSSQPLVLDVRGPLTAPVVSPAGRRAAPASTR